ncbi:MAG: isoprenylcysteine carboxylmethyltransferase family protein [Terracidiphilus sp.]
MGASAIEFRLRMVINAAIIILGFWAPWIETWHIGHRIPLLGWLALELSRTGIASFTVATPLLLIIATLIAAKGALFRVWGTAYLGAGTVNSFNMVAGKVMADGPYRYMRNPLYIGLWCMVIAAAFLMPAGGAAFAVILIGIFAVRLTLGEEAFLTARLGEPYLAYMRAVPRFIPRLRGAPAPTGAKPHWLRAMLAELTPIGILIAIVVFSRNYDLELAGRIILVFFGASLVVRALMPGVKINSAK